MLTNVKLRHRCTLQKRARTQKLSYATGTSVFTVGKTLTGATSHATAIIKTVVGTATTGYLTLYNVTGTFQSAEAIDDDNTSPGHAHTTSVCSNFLTAGNQPEYYWKDDQTNVPCLFSIASGRVQVLDAGEYTDINTTILLPNTVTVNSRDYRVVSTQLGYSGTFQLFVPAKAPYRAQGGMFVLDHYEFLLKEIA